MEYHFTDLTTMEREIHEGKFLESAKVHGDRYGTSRAAVDDVVGRQGKICILDIDVQGAESVSTQKLALGRKIKFLFIRPPSMEALEARLRGRGTESEERIQRRLLTAKSEMDYLEKKNPELFDQVFVNDQLEACYTQLKAVLKKWGAF